MQAPVETMKFRSTGGDVRVSSTTGHTAIIGAEWRTLPVILHREALAAGCECDRGRFRAEKGSIESSDEAKNRPNTQDDVIRTALETMLSRNEEGDFNADSLPNVNAVMKLASMSLRKADVLRVFRAMQADAGSGDNDGGEDGEQAE